MPDDAITGATYYDSIFQSSFEIVDIEPDEYDSVDPEEITLTLEYETVGTVTIDLEQFRDDEDIELVDVPE